MSFSTRQPVLHSYDTMDGPLLLGPVFTGKPTKLNAVEGCIIAAIAPCIAVLFTSPFDTAKVRLQLQGESVRSISDVPLSANVPGSTRCPPPVIYKNSFDCISKIFRYEGVAGLYKGLVPAICREGSKNLFRLGLFDPVLRIMHPDTATSAPVWKRLIAGAICGATGAAACNPFELVKTRLQSHASSGIAVGHQHQYSSMRDAFGQILQQDGVAGLYKGSIISIMRSIGGSGANLTVYSTTKERLINNFGMKDSTTVDMIAGMWSGVSSCIVMNPFDVTRTRYYNQPFLHGKGQLYSSGLETARKLYQNEGLFAFYKGFTSHFLRIGPHFCLSFIFLGILRRNLIQYYDDADMMHSFANCDRDHDGLLDVSEVSRALRSAVPPDSFQRLPRENYDALIDEYASRVMLKADPQRRGFVDYENFVEMAGEIGHILRETHIKKAFYEIDRDGNGKIDKEDLTAALKEMVPSKLAQTVSPIEREKFVSDNAGKIVSVLTQKNHLANADYITLDQFQGMVEGMADVSQKLVLEKWLKSANSGLAEV